MILYRLFVKPIMQYALHSGLENAIYWITSYISFYFSEPISIEDMAKRAGISASRFQVVFKQSFGRSPHQYLLKVRIEHAQELLKTFHSIQLVSEYCGFSDVHHFSNAFKKATGFSPAKYRDSISKGGHSYA
jgi:transcriptional regulator GlxA family with amidase domain